MNPPNQQNQANQSEILTPEELSALLRNDKPVLRDYIDQTMAGNTLLAKGVGGAAALPMMLLKAKPRYILPTTIG